MMKIKLVRDHLELIQYFKIHVSEKILLIDSSKSSKLYFVDLADSEKIFKTNVI